MKKEDIKIVIAIDSFKGSISSKEAAIAIERGILNYSKDKILIEKVIVADGGEGTVEAIIENTKGKYEYVEVSNPFGKKRQAKIGILKKEIAVLEMAEAAGINLIKLEELNPYKTTTYGVGEMIRAVLDMGIKKIYIGLGGSATNDGGAGMLNALGVKFYDKHKNEFFPTPEKLRNLESIDYSELDKRLKDVDIHILSDVNNILCGINGASYIYGPQKGATKKDVVVLDEILKKYSEILDEKLGVKFADEPGSGAAGGIGYALLSLCNGVFKQGVDEILKMIEFEKIISDADLIITGEGRIDNQSINGKTPIGIAKISKKYEKSVIAIVGSSSKELDLIYQNGIDLVLDIINEPMNLDEAINNVKQLLEFTGEKAIRAYMLRK
ncbi:glycerate kinase [Cetobacterium somerae]|uniref:glycerate kinase n=1 Tax=Cetobacterium somerae TaxID=188913 RepID=UPI003892BC46